MAHPLRIDYDAVEAELCRRSLPDFIAKAWPLVEPNRPLVWNWHLDALADVLARITAGELNRVIINIPPGFMKSLMVSVFWPAWEWASDPGLSYLTFSYSSDNTIRDNRRVRDLVTSEWFQRHYSLRLASDQGAKVRFDTTAKGWRIASSVDGIGTGEHPRRIIIDDAAKATEAQSEVERRSVGDWYDNTISTRLANDPAIIVVGQRLHMEDLPGRLLAKGGWELVRFPMRFDPAGADPRDPRQVAGALLWPENWPEEKVRAEELSLGPYGTAGQLQQRPVPSGGGLFKREWFKLKAAPPAAARRCRGWDTAATEDGGDWTAGVRLALTEGDDIYVEDVKRAQVGPAGLDALMLQTTQLDGGEVIQREGREGGASGKSVIAARAKLLKGFDYAEEATSGNKVTRAGPFRAQCEAGNVYLVTGPDPDHPAAWIEPYLQVMESFPFGRYDDDVDGSSTAYNSLVAGFVQQPRIDTPRPDPTKPAIEERWRERDRRRAERESGRVGRRR